MEPIGKAAWIIAENASRIAFVAEIALVSVVLSPIIILSRILNQNN